MWQMCHVASPPLVAEGTDDDNRKKMVVELFTYPLPTAEHSIVKEGGTWSGLSLSSYPPSSKFGIKASEALWGVS